MLRTFSLLFRLSVHWSHQLHNNTHSLMEPHETGNFELRGHHGSVGQPTISLEGDKFRKGCLYVLIGWASGLVVSPASCLCVLTLLLFRSFCGELSLGVGRSGCVRSAMTALSVWLGSWVHFLRSLRQEPFGSDRRPRVKLSVSGGVSDQQ